MHCMAKMVCLENGKEASIDSGLLIRNSSAIFLIILMQYNL